MRFQKGSGYSIQEIGMRRSLFSKKNRDELEPPEKPSTWKKRKQSMPRHWLAWNEMPIGVKLIGHLTGEELLFFLRRCTSKLGHTPTPTRWWATVIFPSLLEAGVWRSTVRDYRYLSA